MLYLQSVQKHSKPGNEAKRYLYLQSVHKHSKPSNEETKVMVTVVSLLKYDAFEIMLKTTPRK